MSNSISQETLPAWAAGFFDGEGSVSFSRSGVNRYLLVAVSNKNESGLIRLQTAYGGRIWRDRRSGGCSKWYLQAKGAEAFLRAILPYSAQKVEAIEVALEFQLTVGPRGTRRIPDQVRELRKALHDKLIAINKRD